MRAKWGLWVFGLVVGLCLAAPPSADAQRSRRGGARTSSKPEIAPSTRELQRLRILGTWRVVGASNYGFDELSLIAEGGKLERLTGTVNRRKNADGREGDPYKAPLTDIKFDGKTLSFKYPELSDGDGGSPKPRGTRKLKLKLVADNELQDAKDPLTRLRRVQ